MKRLLLALLALTLAAAFFAIQFLADSPPGLKDEPRAQHPTKAPEVKPREELTKSAMQQKPNVVEVLVDDMRYDDFQYMPFLSSLMQKEGTFLANGFSNYPLCCPARASFLTGQLPHNHKVYHVNDNYGYGAFDDRATLSVSLKQEGYQTAFFGKYLNNYGKHNALAPVKEWQAAGALGPEPQVQSQYYVPAGWDQWRAGIGGVYCSPACGGEYNYFAYAYSKNGVPTSAPRGEYSTDFITREAIKVSRKFTAKREKAGNPFFLSLNYVAPHNGGGSQKHDPIGHEYRQHECALGAPSAPTWAYNDELVKAAVPMGVTQGGFSEESLEDKVGAFARHAPFSTCELEALQNLTHARAAAMRAVDANLEKLAKKLRASKQWENTVFLFWSDNGYLQGEHRKPAGKSSIHEPSLRVPMFITGPELRTSSAEAGIWGGRDLYSPVNVPDLTATLLDYAGAEAPHLPDGQSIRPQLNGETKGFEELVVYESALTDAEPGMAGTDEVHFLKRFDGVRDPRKVVGVRTGRYSYARYDNGAGELYDNVQDPHQWHNLFARPAWLKKNAALVKTLDELVAAGATCKGVEQCQLRLPKELQVSSGELKVATREWYAKVFSFPQMN